MRALLALSFLAFSAPGLAQDRVRTVEVRLSSFDFEPETIRLAAGEPVVLRLVNAGRGGHNFSAPQFFAAAGHVSGPVRRGAVEVPSRATVDIRVVPRPGRYRLRCTHTLHSDFGMTGEILVQ
jgi:uncharacterized cupredoxin-like copper-binding protein